MSFSWIRICIPKYLGRFTRSEVNAFHTYSALLAPKKGKQALATKVDKFLDTETDPERLCKYVCGANIMREGSDPEIKPDSEYPDWLWTLDVSRKPAKPQYGSQKYWKRVRTVTIRQSNTLRRKI